MTTPTQIAPTRGTNASSYEWILDVGIVPENPGDPIDWLNVPDITALAPNSTQTTADGSTYANQGQTDTATIGESFNLSVNVKVVTDTAGDVIPALNLMIEAANALLDQERAGDRVLAIRFYHYKLANMAYEYTADITWTRQNTGNVDLEFLAFTLTGKGDRKVIPNPALVPLAVAALVSALPSGAAEGDIVRITGSDLKGATSVKFGTDEAATFVIVGGTAIYATLPAGTAGSAAIIVTTSAGASNSLAYTRA